MTTYVQRRQRLLAVIHHWMRRHGAWYVLAVFFLTVSVSAHAEETKPAPPTSLLKVLSGKKSPVALSTEKKDEKKVMKTLTGTVSFIRKNRMAVEFKPGEEILLAVDPAVKLSRAKAFSEIATGDRISVKYLEVFKEPKEKGGERVVLSMTVKEVSLDKKKKVEELVS